MSHFWYSQLQKGFCRWVVWSRCRNLRPSGAESLKNECLFMVHQHFLLTQQAITSCVTLSSWGKDFLDYINPEAGIICLAYLGPMVFRDDRYSNDTLEAFPRGKLLAFTIAFPHLWIRWNHQILLLQPSGTCGIQLLCPYRTTPSASQSPFKLPSSYDSKPPEIMV